MATSLTPSTVLMIDEPDLLHLGAGARGVQLSAVDVGGSQSLSIGLAPHQGVLLSTHGAALRVQEGEAAMTRIGVVGFSKLLAFIDGAAVSAPLLETDAAAASGLVVLDLPTPLLTAPRELEYWFLRQVIGGNPEFAALCAFLRRLENYWLVKYLLSESVRQKTVSDLGTEYGLSYSHFRRVCKAALGNSVKSELKSWRAARSLLDVVGQRCSMTEAAIKNGYASSSHFSTEIKKLFGLSPRAIFGLNQ